MKCNQVLSIIPAFVDGEMTGRDAERVREHLAKCATCQRAEAEAERVRHLADAWTAEGTDVWDAVRAEIDRPDIHALVDKVTALQAEVRMLKAEVSALRAQTERQDRTGERLTAATCMPAAARARPCVRIV